MEAQNNINLSVKNNNSKNNSNQKVNIKINEKKKNNKSEPSKKDEKRIFTLVDPLITYKELHGKAVKSKDPRGNYSDVTPGGAARKMFRRIARSRQLERFVAEGKVGQNGTINKTVKIANVVKGADKNVVFSMMEVDKNGMEIKRFYYKGSNKLDEPIMDKFIGFNKKTGKKKTSVQYVIPSIMSITKEEYESKKKNFS